MNCEFLSLLNFLISESVLSPYWSGAVLKDPKKVMWKI